MKFLEVILVLHLCALGSAMGHLNDSRAELIERYGEPLSEKGNQAFGSLECVFEKGEWEVRAFLLDGRCQMISYLKKGVAGDPSPTAIFKTGHWKRLEGVPLGTAATLHSL